MIRTPLLLILLASFSASAACADEFGNRFANISPLAFEDFPLIYAIEPAAGQNRKIETSKEKLLEKKEPQGEPMKFPFEKSFYKKERTP